MPAGPLRDKFKKETVKGILLDIMNGVPYQIAAEKHGVHESTFRDWRSKGLLAIKENRENDYSDMVRALREIEAERITLNINSIRDSEKGHRGKEWELERSFWKYFSSKASEIDLNERVAELEQKRGLENVVETKANSEEGGEDDKESSSDETLSQS